MIRYGILYVYNVQGALKTKLPMIIVFKIALNPAPYGYITN